MVIFIAVLIDAIRLAQVHANFIRDHGYDVRPHIWRLRSLPALTQKR